MKIQIQIENNIKVVDALAKVLAVVNKGKISKSYKHKIKHYCWVSTFKDGSVVQVRQKRNEQSADSFIVYKD